MPELSFAITGAQPADAASPALVFKLRVSTASAEPVRNIALRAQVMIESPKRRYADSESVRLVDLFGERARWDRTLRPLLWAHATTTVAPFDREMEAELPVACTYDFNVAVTKYFDALEDGEVPLLFLFSGTVFRTNRDGQLQIEQIPWSQECAFRLPVRVWKEMMQRYYPNTAWLCLRKDVFDRLHQYKMQRGIPTWEQALESILP
jgi:hypothetical protein